MSTSDAGGDPVILATAGYDHTVRFWQAHSGICYRTVQHQDSVSFDRRTSEIQLKSVALKDNFITTLYHYKTYFSA